VYKIYNHLQNSLTQTYNHIEKQCGSTCLCVLHFQDINNKNVIQILNTGDCRLCVCNGNVGRNLTEDHKPNSIKESITNSIIESTNESNANLNMDISNNDSTMDISNNNYETFMNEYDEDDDKETMSNYMEDKTIIKKLNPTVINSIKKMNSIYIEELNKNINVLNNLKDL
jgi:serine/threonine protein phosphatase PrpC